jgi:hypothetical protein
MIYYENYNGKIIEIKITENIMPTLIRIAESLQTSIIRKQT